MLCRKKSSRFEGKIWRYHRERRDGGRDGGTGGGRNGGREGRRDGGTEGGTGGRRDGETDGGKDRRRERQGGGGWGGENKGILQGRCFECVRACVCVCPAEAGEQDARLLQEFEARLEVCE